MKTMTRKVTLCLGLAVVVAVSIPASAQQAPRAEKYALSGPYAYKNLAVFLIHAKDVKDKTKFITLQEALEEKKVTVGETGTVNKLVIENVSDDVHVYIQSGDIVRGGKQDRTIGCDYVVPPKSGKIPLSSFCVESGRWRQRGSEKPHEFSVSNNALPTRGLKVAANYSRSQGGVWREVADVQDKLSHNLGQPVRSKQSASSLELTLENKEVKRAVQEYVDAISRLIEGKKDVVGFVSAINGELNSADVYASAGLFKKVWPKLLKSCSVEALAELQKTRAFSHPTAQLAAAFLQNDDQAKIHERQINDQLRVITRQSKDRIVFETYEAGKQKALHKSYIRVDPERLQQEAQQTQSPQTRRSITNSIQQQEPPQ